MAVRRFSAGLLVSMLLGPGYNTSLTFQHVTPLTLKPHGPALRMTWDARNFHALDVGTGILAVRTTNAVKVVDTTRLQVVATYPLRARDVCAVGLDGTAPVALVGCATRTSRAYAVVRLGASNTRVRVRRPLASIVYPVSFAFGDGKVFVSHAFGAVDAIDLRTGAVVSHRPLRTLAKGRGYVQAAWLGDHLLGLNGTVIDVRTWHRTTLAAHAQKIVAGGDKLATVGPDGVNIFSKHDLRLYRRLLRGTVVDDAFIDRNVLYARVALVWHVFDIRTGRSRDQVLLDNAPALQLLPG